jgi:osmotically-inducible protein OsmY
VRDEPSAGDLVGTITAAEAASKFVGRESAVTAAVSSVTGLTEEARAPLNRPRIIRPTGLYAERLTLAPDVANSGTTSQNNVAESSQISESLQSFIQSRSLMIEVSPEDHSAILRGAVPSEADRQQTELLVMFEPGIQKVVNELTVDSSLPPISRRRRGLNSSRN